MKERASEDSKLLNSELVEVGVQKDILEPVKVESNDRKSSSAVIATSFVEQKIPPFRYFVLTLFITLILCAVIFGTVQKDVMKKQYKYVIGTLGLCILGYLLLYVDYCGKFKSVQQSFEQGCNRKLPTIILIIFCVLSFLVVISRSLSDSSDENRLIDSNELDSIEIVVGSICVMLALFVFIGFWDVFSYNAASNPFIHAFLYCSILGYIIISLCRFLRPPQKAGKYSWNWHDYHPTNKLMDKICKVTLFATLFFPTMSCFVLASFTELSTSLQGLNFWVVFTVFTAMALLIMITPLAPGSAVDMVGGYLLIYLFHVSKQFDYNFIEGWALALAYVVFLHFMGSCAQWFVGRMSCAQGWLNRSLPPMLLAASDSTLKTAGCFKVGVVGQVFMDTANGLNQGRMNMAFCTQFWSEWSSLPNALSLVTLGALLGSPMPAMMSTIPIIMLVALVWQTLASAWGAKKLAGSVDTVEYWTSYEKWTSVQYFAKCGYLITKAGWEADAFQLSIPGGLFDKIKPAIERQASEASEAESKKCEQMLVLKHKAKFAAYRQKHFNTFTPEVLNKLEEQGYVAYDKSMVVHEGVWMFHDASFSNFKGWVQMFLMLSMYFLGLGAYFCLNIDMDVAVTRGLAYYTGDPEGSDDVAPRGMLGLYLLAAYYITAVIYWHQSLIGSVVDLVRFIFSMIQCKCTKDIGQLETEFPTPVWRSHEYEIEVGNNVSTNL